MNSIAIHHRFPASTLSRYAGILASAFLLIGSATKGVCATGATAEFPEEQAADEVSVPAKPRDPWILKPGTSTASKQVASFELKDQHGGIHSRKFPTSKPVLLVIADPRASRKLKEWTAPLGEQLKDRVDVVAVADLSRVPENFRAMATDSVRKKRSEKVLMDWEGLVSKPLDCRPNVPNLALVSTNGTLLVQVGAAATKALTLEFLDEVEKLLVQTGLAAKPAGGIR